LGIYFIFSIKNHFAFYIYLKLPTNPDGSGLGIFGNVFIFQTILLEKQINSSKNLDQGCPEL